MSLSNTIIKYRTDGTVMVQSFDRDCPISIAQYGEIFRDSGTGYYETSHQRAKIQELEKQLEQKQQTNTKKLSNLIAYYYKQR